MHDFPAGAPTLRATTSDTERGLAFDANNGTLLVPQGGLSVSDEHAVVHEYGHFLDKTVLGTSGRFASVSGETQGVLDAIGRTDASKVWADAASRSFESPQESFARAYEQWIATRSGNAEMRAEQEAATHRGVPSYWTDADFKQVGSAMDDLFRSSGLLRESAESARPIGTLLNPDLIPATSEHGIPVTHEEKMTQADASHYYPGAPPESLADVEYMQGKQKGLWMTQAHTDSWEVYEARANKVVKDALADKDVMVRVPPSVLGQIIQDGRFKSQFETGASKGMLNPDVRAVKEYEMFGYAKDLDPTLRPIYGYVEGSSDGSLDSYGSIDVRLKPEVRDRTTVGFRDSFSGGGQSWLPTPLTNPTRIATPSDPIYDAKLAEGKTQPKNLDAGQYAEAQIHGGLAVSDIAEVILERGDDLASLEARLKESGIPYRLK